MCKVVDDIPQICETHYQNLQGKLEIDKNEKITIDKIILDDLLGKATKMCNLNQELTQLRSMCATTFGKGGVPGTDPGEFRVLCSKAGSHKLFDTIVDAMKSERQSK